MRLPTQRGREVREGNHVRDQPSQDVTGMHSGEVLISKEVPYGNSTYKEITHI